MQIIARKTLSSFWLKHPETRHVLERWIEIVKAANWSSMNDIRIAFPKAKILNAERVRFEVHGGDYRMIVSFDFAGQRRIAYIKFIGTHAEYDGIDALSVSRF